MFNVPSSVPFWLWCVCVCVSDIEKNEMIQFLKWKSIFFCFPVEYHPIHWYIGVCERSHFWYKNEKQKRFGWIIFHWLKRNGKKTTGFHLVFFLFLWMDEKKTWTKKKILFYSLWQLNLRAFTKLISFSDVIVMDFTSALFVE